MITIGSLWLAILLAAVLMWIASAIIWTVLPHHKSEYKGLPDEDAVRNALQPQNLRPGLYNIPHLKTREELETPAAQKNFSEGPVGYLTVLPNGVPNMGKAMVLQFIYFLIIGGIVAYVTSRTLEPGAAYLAVFQIAGTVAWVACGVGIIPEAIWFGRPWSVVIKHQLDALAYGLLTGGVFGWLWPAG